MASRAKRIALRPVPYLFTDWIGHLITRLFSKKFREELTGALTDEFLELLLRCQDLAFCLSKGYRKNIKDFKGRYVFCTREGLVAASATFENGDMKVHDEPIEDWDVRITFENQAALRGFIFSGEHDILDSILENKVEVEGNLNYMYKYAFMVRDLGRKLGVV